MLFVFDAELLLFIYHYESEVFECDVALDQPMSADDDVDLAAGQSLQDFLLLVSETETWR